MDATDRLSASSASERLSAQQRLADYPERVERLKRLWIKLEDKPVPVRYAGSSIRRSGSFSATGSTGISEAAAASRGRRDASPSPAPAAARRSNSPSAPSAAPVARASPARSPAKRDPSPSAAVAVASRQSRPAVAKRAAVPKRAPARSGSRSRVPQGPLTARQIQELMSRELSPEDYELLLLLDEGVVKKAKVLSSDHVAVLPRATGTAWIDEACPICLCALEQDEDIRMLPTCGHHFHAPCAMRWLSVEKATCPLCGREESTLEKIIDLFRKFDSKGDGLLELEDVKSVLVKLDPGFWDLERVGRFFKTADVNQEGKLNAAAFVNWLFVDDSIPELTRSVTRHRMREAIES